MDRLSESDGGCEREDFLPKKDSAVESTEEHQDSCGQDPKGNRFCRWLRNNKKCAVCMFVVAICIATAIIVLHAILKHTRDNNGQQNANVSTLSTVEPNSQPLIEKKCIQDDDGYCSIQIPANTSRLEAQSCGPQNCFECKGTCLGADVIRGMLNQHIECNNSQRFIDCCVVRSASGNGQCGEHGELVCINSTNPPDCQCHLGWTGPYCNKTDLVEALCNCDASNQTIAVENCFSVDRPKDWHICLHVLSDGTQCRCANYESGFLKVRKPTLIA
ncbi:uncharacterized protein LOC127838980 isoform X2 [Dreissena polymorpha]|uniref:uncharacterized protein LOC127838980 isoform X2 n=1 Tax=Dreissena polymorpha TaxID=45954 RepID=UPI002264C3AE|nr:uncharacterized protein LOC127838980 isoform X2 [Dreissena polymorpha]